MLRVVHGVRCRALAVLLVGIGGSGALVVDLLLVQVMLLGL